MVGVVHTGLVALALVTAACAAAAPPNAPEADARSLDAALAAYAIATTSRAEARRLAPVVSPRTIREPRPTAVPRPVARRRRVDVRLADADLEHALALLAAVGHFGLVANSLPPDRVTLTLRDVDPYDALLAICSAHGVTVRATGRVVVVTAQR